MRLLLDTHLILWWQGMRAKVPSAARASLWEIAIKINLGKLGVDLSKFCEKVAADGFSWLPIENAHILRIAALPAFADHKDPFDRLLVAQSLSEPLILLTADVKLARYGSTVRVV